LVKGRKAEALKVQKIPFWEIQGEKVPCLGDLWRKVPLGEKSPLGDLRLKVPFRGFRGKKKSPFRGFMEKKSPFRGFRGKKSPLLGDLGA
jgi:hypothetical protein